MITNVGEVVPRDRINFEFFLDLGVFIIGISLVLCSLIVNPYYPKGIKRSRFSKSQLLAFGSK